MTNRLITHIGTSPETLINQMREALNELIAKSHRAKPSSALTNILMKMKDLYFKFNMAKLMNDKTILSITGLQGVGKTKMVRDLYHLDDSLLPSDGGRGEVLPVLFTESPNTKDISYIVRRAIRDQNGFYELVDVEVTLQEFNAISADPDKDDVWLEARLPQRYFNTEISLALLPGFERDRNQLSQKYLDTFLALSTSVLLVFNHKKLAQLDQQLLIAKVASDYKESAPIFALSFAEELNAQQRVELQNDLCQKFNIPANETDRIVFTGTSEEVKNFPEQIINAIYQYSLTNSSGYILQLRMLTSLTSELVEVTNELEEELSSIKADTIYKQLQKEKSSQDVGLYEIREAFRQYRKNVTADVRNVVNRTLSNHAKICSEQMDDSIKAEKHSTLDKLKSAFTKQISFEEQLQFKSQIKEIWNGENEIESERVLIDSLDTFVKKETNQLKPQAQQARLEKPVNPLRAVSTTSGEDASQVDSNEVVRTALANIDRYINTADTDLSVRLTKNDLKVLPVIAVGIAQEMVAASLVLDNDKFELLEPKVQQEILNKSNRLISEFQDLTLSTSTVVKGAALFFGIDALDGTFNTFGALTSILTSLGVSSAAAAPLGLLIVGAVGSGLAISKGSERIEKYKFERSHLSKELFKSFATTQEESVIATINNILDKMEEKLIDTYHQRRGTDKNFGLMDELDHRLNRLQHMCGEMQELAFRNESYVY
ncbi:hypothetical protein G6549_13785 [Bacillus sp. MM2020_1]|nr:hypothetical protein [Bacillus sp. MM2020_1]